MVDQVAEKQKLLEQLKKPTADKKKMDIFGYTEMDE